MDIGLELAKVCEEFICILNKLKANSIITEEEFILYSKEKIRFIEENCLLEA
ncbi:hypothetical protein RBU61_02455 [Tissierella sp. MB52-C2]|uniref:hypothetical protein n=1 Tax=Tissierella sp. MB52-C2 TaxID=3070999 RepID=UPI00280B5E8A|nr:hypothetical protein [Tissierella sp. MB52-C2]WMM25545.1 hypothetical protein RBU61_02455 [Tissierella sp. MB52-C2]